MATPPSVGATATFCNAQMVLFSGTSSRHNLVQRSPPGQMVLFVFYCCLDHPGRCARGEVFVHAACVCGWKYYAHAVMGEQDIPLCLWIRAVCIWWTGQFKACPCVWGLDKHVCWWAYSCVIGLAILAAFAPQVMPRGSVSAPGIFFYPCPTGDILEGALRGHT